MSMRVRVIAIVTVLSGCTLQGCSVLNAMSKSDCWYGVVPRSYPERCMTYAEYQAARGKQRHTQDRFEYKTARERQRRAPDKAVQNGANQADAGYKDWIP
jgi:hypothetical protein